MFGPFEITKDDFNKFDQYTAVSFFRKLLWTEADRVGVSKHLINVPDCINVGDGGIDAYIEGASPIIDDIIPKGSSIFQIKKSNLYPKGCKNELHIDRNPRKPIKPELEKRLFAGATYILVLYADLTVPKCEERKVAIKDELEQKIGKKIDVRLYSLNQIVEFSNRFYQIKLTIKPELNNVLPHEKWKLCLDIASPKKFYHDTLRDGFLQEIREKIREKNDNFIRITGLPGLGKTRLVFETLDDHDLRNIVLYGKADNLLNSGIINNLCYNNESHAIIVADECSLDEHNILVNKLDSYKNRISLVTISNEFGEPYKRILTYNLSPMNDIAMRDLLENELSITDYSIIKRLIIFSDGYPRLAVLLADNIKANPSHDIFNIDDTKLFDRLVAGRYGTQHRDYKNIKRTLQSISLFQKLGFEDYAFKESKWVAENIAKIDWEDFRAIVHENKQRGIIQGEYYLYISPTPLAVYLRRKWFSEKSKEEIINLIERMNNDLGIDASKRFIVNFSFIGTTNQGSKLISELLSDDGIYKDGMLLDNDLGSLLFFRLTEADPIAALNRLKKNLGKKTKEELLKFRIGRFNIVSSLERIVVWKNLFSDGARLLAKLGEAETECYSNNASGIFSGLFTSALMFPTEVSPIERFKVLKEIFETNSYELKKLAIKAFYVALQTSHFIHISTTEVQESKPLLNLWIPKDNDEIFIYWKTVWEYLDNQLEQSEPEIKKELIQLLLNNARGIAVQNEKFSEMVIKSIRKIVNLSSSFKTESIKTISQFIHFEKENISTEQLERWKYLKKDLIGEGFEAILHRYVGMEIFEDFFHDGGNFSSEWLVSQFDKLAKEIIENPTLLESSYQWLFSKDSVRGYGFGQVLGIKDSKFSFLKSIIDFLKKVDKENLNLQFIGGYLKALFESDNIKWEKSILSLLEDEGLKYLIPEIVSSSGLTGKIAVHILELAKTKYMELSKFRYFRLSELDESISNSIQIDWLSFLVSKESGEKAIISLDLLYNWFYNKKLTLPSELIVKILLNDVFWDKPDNISYPNLIEYYWNKVAISFCETYPGEEVNLLKKIFETFGNENSISCGIAVRSDINEFLENAIMKDPLTAWNEVKKQLSSSNEIKLFDLIQWLRGGHGFIKKKAYIELFKPNDIWNWVDESINERAVLIASCVPQSLFHTADKVCLARELLIRYGNSEEVKNAFTRNYYSHGYSGKPSIHYKEIIQQLITFLKDEDNENVINWIDGYITSLEKLKHDAEIEEDRRGF